MTSQMAEKYSTLRFWYWRLQSLLALTDSFPKRESLLVGVLPGINTEQRLELADNGVLVLGRVSKLNKTG